MSRFGIVGRRVNNPDTSRLVCLKKTYLDSFISCVIYSKPHGGGVYIHILNNDRWYLLDYKLPDVVLGVK